MNESSPSQLQLLDQAHVWHPYSSMGAGPPAFPVASAEGVRLTLTDGRVLIDGMSSWWSAIHGYNHPVLNQAIVTQLHSMAHVMFGGLTHEPAIDLALKLVELTPAPLQKVFFSDSGSVAVEVAMKMAIQYWHAKRQPQKQHFLTLHGGYHGDTFGAMSVCDPITGMHGLFKEALSQQYFVAAPTCDFGQPCPDSAIEAMAATLQQHGDNIAAVILEPIVQGAGGMRFYAAEYLRQVHELCQQHHTLLIFDEIATGFGRTGKMFAGEHADVSPDILCVGKALTGGYMSLAATLTTTAVSDVINQGDPGLFMHGPTFMANPLACSVALASIDLLLQSPWQQRVQHLAERLSAGLAPCRDLPQVADVRVLGAIGVVELHQPVDMDIMQQQFVAAGVWVRPFGKLVYLMPPYIIDDADLDMLTRAVCAVVAQHQ